jgi:hypothetical protein
VSGGTFCVCKLHYAARLVHWKIVQYRSNHSAFNGYRETTSNYSEIMCTKCKYSWRTKAAYVAHLGHATREEAMA